MATLDTLAYAKFLEASGIDGRAAVALAEGARDYVMRDLATKDDLKALANQLTIRVGSMFVAFGAFLFAALRAFPH